MSSDDLTLLVIAAFVVVVVVVLVAVVVLRVRTLRRRFRASCASLGLVQTPAAWVGGIDGIPVGVAWVRYLIYRGGSAETQWRTSFRATIAPPLGLGLIAYGHARGLHALRPTRVQTWEMADQPSTGSFGPSPPGEPAAGISLGDPSLDGRLHATARDPRRAAAVIAAAAKELREILPTGVDLRIADDGVEILGDGYENQREPIRRGLEVAARLAASLSRARA